MATLSFLTQPYTPLNKDPVHTFTLNDGRSASLYHASIVDGTFFRYDIVIAGDLAEEGVQMDHFPWSNNAAEDYVRSEFDGYVFEPIRVRRRF